MAEFGTRTPKIFINFEPTEHFLDNIALSSSVYEPVNELWELQKPQPVKPIEEEKNVDLLRLSVKKEMGNMIESIMFKMKEDADEMRLKWEKNLYKDSVHEGFKCALCEMEPIKGIRYWSVIKENYDLCVDCESKIGQEDVFLKIKTPEDYETFLVELRKVPGV